MWGEARWINARRAATAREDFAAPLFFTTAAPGLGLTAGDDSRTAFARFPGLAAPPRR